MTVNPISFGDTGSSGEDGGWKTVYNQDQSQGLLHNDLLPDDDKAAIKLRPRVVTKPKRLANEMPPVGGPDPKATRYTVRNRPERVPVLFQPDSPSTKEYYYAPVDIEGEALNLPHEWPAESPTTYGDSDLNLELGSDGYRNTEQDSNFSRKPKTWRFKTKDIDMSLIEKSEILPSLVDIGVSEMIYPLQGGLRPVVFAATPKRGKKSDKRKRKAEDTSEHLDDFKIEDNGSVLVAMDATGQPIVRYGVLDGKGILEPSFDKSENGEQWIKGLALLLRNLEFLPQEVVLGGLLPDVPTEVEEMNKNFVGPKETSQGGYRSVYRGDVLQDPALEGLKDMTKTEKLFTTIRKWEGNSYVIGADKLDSGMKAVLAENPVSTGKEKYFNWQYVSPEQSKKGVAKDIKKEGFTVREGQGVLVVTRLDGWKQAEAEVQKKRRVRPA